MPDDPKSLLRRFYEEVSTGNLGAIDEMISDDLVEHEEFPGLQPSKDGVKQFFAMFQAAFPDMRMEPHEVLAEGDLVCARVTFTGTHRGEFMGIPATGRRVEVQMFDLVRFRDDQAVEHWGTTDSMTLMEQLGAMTQETPA